MGCDIIMHSQVKASDGLWDWYDTNIFDDRAYTLFGILSGTRGEEFKPIVKEYRGFPTDSRDKLKHIDSYDYDYTTQSGVYLGYAGVYYLTLTELKSFDWKQKIPGENPPFDSMEDWYFVTNILPYLEVVSEKVGGSDNVRIVFGYSV